MSKETRCAHCGETVNEDSRLTKAHDVSRGCANYRLTAKGLNDDRIDCVRRGKVSLLDPLADCCGPLCPDWASRELKHETTSTRTSDTVKNPFNKPQIIDGRDALLLALAKGLEELQEAVKKLQEEAFEQKKVITVISQLKETI